MSLKLDDLIGKKKEVVQILDLSKATANNPEEFKKVMEKVPDFKMKPEKVKPEDVKIQDRPKRWNRKPKKVPYQFSNPIPQEMQSLRLADLCSVPIQWNMLTTLRPKSKVDEEYFSRLVELGKLELSTQQKEKRLPLAEYMRKTKNRGGVGETRWLSCQECGEDFCQGEVCSLLQYDNFKRQALPEVLGKKEPEERGKGKRRKTKGRAGRASRSRARSRTARPKSRGRSESSRGRPESKGSPGGAKEGQPSSKSGSRKSRSGSVGGGKKQPPGGPQQQQQPSTSGQKKTKVKKAKGKSKTRKGSNSNVRKSTKK